MFESITPRPPDAILGLTAAFLADPNPNKVDLGVGVYKDEQGRTPIMRSIKAAEKKLWESEDTKTYIAQAGPDLYNTHSSRLILGDNHPVLRDQRAMTVLAPGGSGALRLGAEFINRMKSGTRIWVSNPTWANHTGLFKSAGLNPEPHPYYNYAAHVIDFDAMMDTLGKQATVGDLVLLHGCCHNPSGADLNMDQWRAVCALAQKNGFTPYVDLAYQGLGDGVDEDAAGLRHLAENLPELVIASSYSKNFGLYRERVGVLTIVHEQASQVAATKSQVLATAREIYSVPPAHGAALVAMVLDTPELRADWAVELADMRDRINGLRQMLADKLKAAGASRDFSFIPAEKGMFSFLGLTRDQVQRMIKEYSIYLTDNSRINVAGLNSQNVEHLVKAILGVL
ncbi:MAG: aspartate/tyrosine/aromatic aminotransferase [Gammaproteobacteria bacterium]|nr:aspartate/tyrosine/aromatic aminotransferase [Gammaproteobacteria bacterium]